MAFLSIHTQRPDPQECQVTWRWHVGCHAGHKRDVSPEPQGQRGVSQRGQGRPGLSTDGGIRPLTPAGTATDLAATYQLWPKGFATER